MIDTVSPAATERLTSASTRLSPNDFETPWRVSIGDVSASVTAGASCSWAGRSQPGHPVLEPARRPGEGLDDGVIVEGEQQVDLEWHEMDGDDGLTGARQLVHGDHRQQRRVLRHRDELVG